VALRKQTQLTFTKLSLRDVLSRENPMGEKPEGGLCENLIPHRGRITRMAFAPEFQASSSSSRVWKIVEFKFVRDSNPESQLLIFKSDGKVYRRTAGAELEVFPGRTGLSALAAKPSVISIASRLHVDDGSQYLIFDGWDWVRAGMTAPAAAPTTAFVAGSLTGTYRVCVSAVHQRNGVRIHESNRSPITGDIAPAAQNIRVTKPGDLDSRATHWSVYLSEISGAGNRVRRVVTVDKNTATTDVSANPASIAPFAPYRNDKPQASGILFQWKNRIGMGDRSSPDNFWFSSFEEVKANLNGAPDECVPGRDSSSISDIVNSWRLPDKGEVLRGGVWHENFAFLGTDRNGYVVTGEGGLLDDRAFKRFLPAAYVLRWRLWALGDDV
jgi:hypothetical protein